MDTVLEVGKKMLLCLILFVVWLVAPAVCYVAFWVWVPYMVGKLILKGGYRYLVFLSNMNVAAGILLMMITIMCVAPFWNPRNFDVLGYFISPMNWGEDLFDWLNFGFYLNVMICAIAYGLISMAIMYVFYVRVLKD